MGINKQMSKDANKSFFFILMKISILGFLRSLISNLKIYFENVKWQIQYDEPENNIF